METTNGWTVKGGTPRKRNCAQGRSPHLSILIAPWIAKRSRSLPALSYAGLGHKIAARSPGPLSVAPAFHEKKAGRTRFALLAARKRPPPSARRATSASTRGHPGGRGSRPAVRILAAYGSPGASPSQTCGSNLVVSPGQGQRQIWGLRGPWLEHPAPANCGWKPQPRGKWPHFLALTEH
jgi:hypothetical protein